MTRPTNRTLGLQWLGGLALMLLLTSGAFAQERGELADVRYSSTSIDFKILQDTNGVELSVAGGNCLFNRDYGRVGGLSFEASMGGKPLPDGVYRWELRGLQPGVKPIPSGLNNGRDDIEPDKKEDGFLNRGNKGYKIIQVGSFRVVKGIIPDRNQQEPRGKSER